MIQIIVLQRLNEKYERKIDGEIRKNYINSYNISVGNLRKLLNIYENFRQPNRKSLCVRGISAFINEQATLKCATLNVNIL